MTASGGNCMAVDEMENPRGSTKLDRHGGHRLYEGDLMVVGQKPMHERPYS